ncbi:hypothetical protein T02_11322 [Trichinella nativa]|uniref:Uncharacterized protein n=1 Tax=Trichinella nativa TaxID=6335 RepID=A0A0V1LEZ6_9BILA|nr:hypothetical protein T02_11322 [Trichinella nativa]
MRNCVVFNRRRNELENSCVKRRHEGCADPNKISISTIPLIFHTKTLLEFSPPGIEKGVYEFIGKYTVGRPVMNKKLVMFFTRKEEDIKTGLNSGRKKLIA